MPDYIVRDPRSGRAMSITLNAPPTDEFVQRLFASQEPVAESQLRAEARQQFAPTMQERSTFGMLPQDHVPPPPHTTAGMLPPSRAVQKVLDATEAATPQGPPPQPTAIQKMQDWATRPRLDVPQFEVGEEDMVRSARETKPGSLQAMGDATTIIGKAMANIGSQIVEDSSSPWGAAGWLTFGGAPLAAAMKMPRLAQGIGAAGISLATPHLATGPYHLAQSETVPQAVSSVFETAIGASGVPGLKPLAQSARGVAQSVRQAATPTLGRLLADDAGSMPLPLSAVPHEQMDLVKDMIRRGEIYPEDVPEWMAFGRQRMPLNEHGVPYPEPPVHDLPVTTRLGVDDALGFSDEAPAPPPAAYGTEAYGKPVRALAQPPAPPPPAVIDARKKAAERFGMAPTPPVASHAGARTALGVMGPSAAAGVQDDPESNWDDVARVALVAGGAASLASAGWFPPALKAQLDDIGVMMRKQFRAEGKTQADSLISTAQRQAIRDIASTPEEAKKLFDAYTSISLPKFGGVNFDARKPILDTLANDKARGGVRLANWSQQRMDLAYAEGVKRTANESWGDGRWLYHLSNGNPGVAVQITRLLGSLSPGTPTDWNVRQAIEAFARATAGEPTADILKAVGAVRPSTARDNIERAMQLGRIFQQKTEALAGAELGVHDQIPIDLWLLRALGGQSDRTPSKGTYKLLSEAISKEAATKGEEPFEYMAKVWMGMQQIAHAPSPSFSSAAGSLKIPGPLTDPSVREHIIEQGSTGALQASLNEAAAAARTGAAQPGAFMPLAQNPELGFDEWLGQSQRLMRAGIEGGDVLGKVKTVKKEKAFTLKSVRDRLFGRTETAYVTTEPVPGGSTGVAPDMITAPLAEKEALNREHLAAFTNAKGKSILQPPARAGQVKPIIGDYIDPAGVRSESPGFASPMQVRLVKQPDGSLAPHPLDKNLLDAQLALQASMQAQDATAFNLLIPDKAGADLMVRTARPVSHEGLAAAKAQYGDAIFLDTGKDGMNILNAPTDPAEARKLADLMYPGTGQRPQVTRAKNVAGPSSYLDITGEWKARNKAVTTTVVGALGKLTPQQFRKLDTEALRGSARQILAAWEKRRASHGSTIPQDYVNYLQVIGTSGLSGLRKALKDPAQILPVLAALGLGPTLLEQARAGLAAESSQ